MTMPESSMASAKSSMGTPPPGALAWLAGYVAGWEMVRPDEDYHIFGTLHLSHLRAVVDDVASLRSQLLEARAERDRIVNAALTRAANAEAAQVREAEARLVAEAEMMTLRHRLRSLREGVRRLPNSYSHGDHVLRADVLRLIPPTTEQDNG